MLHSNTSVSLMEVKPLARLIRVFNPSTASSESILEHARLDFLLDIPKGFLRVESYVDTETQHFSTWQLFDAGQTTESDRYITFDITAGVGDVVRIRASSSIAEISHSSRPVTESSIININITIFYVEPRSSCDIKILDINLRDYVQAPSRAQILRPFIDVASQLQFDIYEGPRKKIVLFQDSLSSNDAMTNHLLLIAAILEEIGHAVDVVSDHIPPELMPVAVESNYCKHSDVDIVYINYGSYSASLHSFLDTLCLDVYCIFYFHGVTPPMELNGESLNRQLQKGIDELKRVLSGVTRFNRYAVVANSSDSRLQLFANAGETLMTLPESSVSVIPPLFLRPNRELSPDLSLRSNIIVLGRLVRHKDVTHALRICECLFRSNMISRLIIAYSTFDYAYKAELLSLISSSDSLRSRVFFFEDLPNSNIEFLWSTAALCLHPSKHEGFGIVIREALLHRVPVLAARVPGFDEDFSPVLKFSSMTLDSLEDDVEIASKLLSNATDRQTHHTYDAIVKEYNIAWYQHLKCIFIG